MKTIKIEEYKIFADDINCIVGNGKTTINTINAHSYVVAKEDPDFRKALVECDILLPDGEGILFMSKILKGEKIKKIAGADIHEHLLRVANNKGLRCFYLGSSQGTLDLIKQKQTLVYPQISFGYFSPPFKAEFTAKDNELMIGRVNQFNPDVLFVGMTAPKQEKWVNEHKDRLNVNVIASIGAVFDFVAQTKSRAPNWMIKYKMEWLYRALTSWRLTKRYLYSNPIFLFSLSKIYLAKRFKSKK